MKLAHAVGTTPASGAVMPAPVSSVGAGARPEATRARPVHESAASTKELAPPPQVGVEAVRNAARQISEFLRTSTPNIEFSVDDGSHEVIVRVLDAETRQVIRQIPSAEVVAISHALGRLGGLLVHQKA